MDNNLQTLKVFFFLMAESIYQSLAFTIYIFFSIIMIIFFLATLIRTKHWNQFTIAIPGPVSMLIYNNFASPILLVYNPNSSVTSLMDLSSNFPSSNSYRILFLWTSSKKLPLSSGFDTILIIINQLTKQAIFIFVYNTIIFIDLTYLFILHMFSKHSIFSHVVSDRGSEFVSNFLYSLGTTLNIQLYFTLDYYFKDKG